MRKPRVIVFDDEFFVLGMLRDFFQMRGYEVLSYANPSTVCPLHGPNGDICTYFDPCADVILADFNMPGLNGVELLDHQRKKRCPLDSRNKAVMSGYIDEVHRRKIDELGFHFLQKPFTIFKLSDWLASCEERIDLSRQLATRRREERFDSYREIVFRMPADPTAVTGIAVNISRSGFCLKAPHALMRDDRVVIDAGHFDTCRHALVRWVKPESNGSFLAGMLCC